MWGQRFLPRREQRTPNMTRVDSRNDIQSRNSQLDFGDDFSVFCFLFSGETCLFAKFGSEVHYKQSKWKQVRSRHEDLPGERGCWRSGCGSKQSQPWRLHLSLPCLFEEWRTFHRNWQKRHLEPPVLWHSINDMGGLCVLRVWTETRVWPQNGLIIVTAIYGILKGNMNEHCIIITANFPIAYVVFPWDKLMTNSCFQTEADVGSTPRYHVWKNCSGHYDGKRVLEVWGFSWHSDDLWQGHFMAFIILHSEFSLLSLQDGEPQSRPWLYIPSGYD